jgi:hypothetical protein
MDYAAYAIRKVENYEAKVGNLSCKVSSKEQWIATSKRENE